MNGKKKKERSKKQSIIIAVVLFVICFALGIALSSFHFSLENRGLSLAETVPYAFNAASHVLALVFVCVTLFFVILMVRYRGHMKRIYASLSPEDDSGLNEMDRTFSKAGIAVAVAVPLEVVFMSVILYLQRLGDDPQMENPLSLMEQAVAMGVMMVGDFVIFLMHRSMLELIKKVNPEKKGELMDLFFHRQWEDSSDEAQKIIMYESGYRAYITMLNLTYVMEAASVVSMVLFDTGILPCIFIGIIAIAGAVVSARTQYRLGQRGWQE